MWLSLPHGWWSWKRLKRGHLNTSTHLFPDYGRSFPNKKDYTLKLWAEVNPPSCLLLNLLWPLYSLQVPSAICSGQNSFLIHFLYRCTNCCLWVKGLFSPAVNVISTWTKILPIDVVYNYRVPIINERNSWSEAGYLSVIVSYIDFRCPITISCMPWLSFHELKLQNNKTQFFSQTGPVGQSW